MFFGFSNAQERTFQSVDSLVNSYAQDLLNNTSADKVLIYKIGCIGCQIIGDCSCKSGNIKSFLLWKETDRSYIKEINCCETSDKKEVDLDIIWEELDGSEEVIFGSAFEAEKENVHYDFYDLNLIKKGLEKEIKMADFFFEPDNQCQKQNSDQPARKFQKMVESVLEK